MIIHRMVFLFVTVVVLGVSGCADDHLPTHRKKNRGLQNKPIAAADQVKSRSESTSPNHRADEGDHTKHAVPIPREVDMGMLYDAYKHPGGTDYYDARQIPQHFELDPEAQIESQLLPWQRQQPFYWDQLDQHPRR